MFQLAPSFTFVQMLLAAASGSAMPWSPVGATGGFGVWSLIYKMSDDSDGRQNCNEHAIAATRRQTRRRRTIRRRRRRRRRRTKQ